MESDQSLTAHLLLALAGALAWVGGVSKTAHYYCLRATPVPHIGVGVELLVQWHALPGISSPFFDETNTHYPALQYIKKTHGSVTQENLCASWWL